MKRIVFALLLLIFSGIVVLFSCKKDNSSSPPPATSVNRAPLAKAGADQIIYLPANTGYLDGSGSTDQDNNIVSYGWTKISGPSSFSLTNVAAIQTLVADLTQGLYEFELKVMDAGGLSSRDTIQIAVLPLPPPECGSDNRPMVNAQLIPVGTLSLPRFEMSVATAGNKILFAGGFIVSGGSSVPSSRVDFYDISTNSWSIGELSIPRYSIAAIGAGNKVFFGGGEIGDGTWPVDSVDVYDISTNTWSVKHLSAPGNGIIAAAAGNKVIFGGGDPGFTGVPGIPRSRQVDIYDLASNTWSTSSFTEPKYGSSAVTFNNKVYFSGGYTPSGISKKIEIYDSQTDTWSYDTMHKEKSFHGGLVVGDKIIWAGGVSVSSGLSCLVDIKNMNTGTRSSEYLFKPSTWNLTTGENLLVKDGKIIFLKTWGDDRDKFDIYDITTNTWAIGRLPFTLPAVSSFISVNNIIYIAGGTTNGTLSNQVWKLEF